MSTNLKVLAAIDFGSAGKAFCGQRAGTSILRKQQPILFQVIIEPWFSLMLFFFPSCLCSHFIFSHLHHHFHLHYPNYSVSHTHTELFVLNWIFVLKKRKKKNFCKIVMFMLYEIFIWNCFAKLLYFCMNVFFIGIRNSYLTLARLLCLICWFSSWVMLYYCETPFFFIFWDFCGFFSISFFGWRNIFLTCPAVRWITLD